MEWFVVVTPIVSLVLDFSIKILGIVLLCKLLPVVKKLKDKL